MLTFNELRYQHAYRYQLNCGIINERICVTYYDIYMNMYGIHCGIFRSQHDNDGIAAVNEHPFLYNS